MKGRLFLFVITVRVFSSWNLYKLYVDVCVTGYSSNERKKQTLLQKSLLITHRTLLLYECTDKCRHTSTDTSLVRQAPCKQRKPRSLVSLQKKILCYLARSPCENVKRFCYASQPKAILTGHCWNFTHKWQLLVLLVVLHSMVCLVLWGSKNLEIKWESAANVQKCLEFLWIWLCFMVKISRYLTEKLQQTDIKKKPLEILIGVV